MKRAMLAAAVLAVVAIGSGAWAMSRGGHMDAAPKKGDADEYRVTNWMPFEISLVDIPADATVGSLFPHPRWSNRMTR